MKVLIIGLGSIAKKHIAALLAIDKETEIFALRSSIDSENVGNVINIYTLASLPAGLDFAIISNPTNLHFNSIIEMANKGIPLFIEKPLVHTADVISDLLTRLKKSHTKTYVACNLRFHPCLQYLHRFITESKGVIINEVNVYCGSYLPDWRPGKDFRKIYSANEEMGGGVHLDLFHEIDYIIWIFGLPEKLKVIKSNHSSLNINAVDYANFNLSYSTFTANLILNYYRIKPKRTIEIVFDNSIWLIDLIKCNITNSNDEVIFEDLSFNILETYEMQLNYFIAALNTQTSIMNSAEESAAALRICLTDE